MNAAPPAIQSVTPEDVQTILPLDDIPHEHVFAGSLTVTHIDISAVVPHVSNIHYVRWIDRMAELHCDAIGWPWDRLAQAKTMWFVARHEIDYLAECFLDDTLLLLTWITDVRRTTSHRAHAIVRRADHSMVCCAHTRWVLVDLQTRRPCRLPADLHRTLQRNRAGDPRAPHPLRTMESACTSP
jgi:acyl-CoA thioester hydrolase